MTIDPARWAELLASGRPIAEPVAVVVAHPDDETLFAGAALARLRQGTLIVVTDGAPRDMADAARLGFATREGYAAARAAELAHALAALGARPRLIRYDVPDQEAVHALPAIVDRLVHDLAGMTAVVTHPYEGGHPDHDAVACAVHRAAARARAPAPAIVEFACYAQFAGEREFARFVADDERHEYVRALAAADRARIEAALAAHATQAAVFGAWRPTHERWRRAPVYDFAAPPPGEACLYDGFGWSLDSSAWRAFAREGAARG